MSLFSCNEVKNNTKTSIPESKIAYAKGFSLETYTDFSILRTKNTFPKSKHTFTYILHKKNIVLPDSLKKYKQITIPIKKIVVTSTTHIPSLEMLGVENTLVGFPSTNYVSSEKTRKRINEGKVRELGNNQNLNTEVLLDIQPDIIVGFSVDGDRKSYENLEKNGQKIIFNADWIEKNPLGKAEWIKFFGALYAKNQEADSIFLSIEKEYKNALEVAKKATRKPTVLAGAIYQEQWFLPQGNSWAALFIKEAKGNYLWANTTGTGSLALSFETVLETAKDAEFWIGPAQFTSIQEMLDENENYGYFKAIQNKNVYSFSIKKGETGGVLYYELAPNRPDLVLKDLIKIMHPELLPNYNLYFFEKLN